MKSMKYIALSAFLTLSAFCAVLYSCTKDECKDVVCQNGGTCAGGNCTCVLGYEGTRCETKSRDKFIGTYIGSEICTIGTDNYSITIATNSDNVKLTMTNLYNNTPVITATGSITTANTFSFSGTQSTITFSGTGTLTGNQLVVAYTITDGASTNSCTFTGNK
ncbi:MAG: hypothetical protein K0Q79_2460 [Flavipsychrobacter sp.]|jgi:hypothetical protein|nr:hypothetical protein [Flavipsychrobacter sp.]